MLHFSTTTLVVTIIIMLILAAVTLNMALGDNGLIQMAKFAANKYEQAADNESTAMGELEGEFPITAKALTKDNYGDYVDYGLDLSNDEDTTNDWRIFYVGGEDDGEANGRIFLIAADYVPNNCDALAQAQILANMKKDWGSGAYCCSDWEYVSSVKYHCNDKHNISLNNGQQQCSFPEIFMPSGDFCREDNHYYCSSHVGSDGAGGNANSRCASALQCTGNWKSFVIDDFADYAIGGPTLEMWVASWNQKHGASERKLYANGSKNNSDSTGYYVGTTSNCNTTKCETYTSHESNRDDLYSYHDFDENGDGGSDGYWLSSPSAIGSDFIITASGSSISCLSYRSQVYNSDGYYSISVRPVVSLKTNINLTKTVASDGRVVWKIHM